MKFIKLFGTLFFSLSVLIIYTSIATASVGGQSLDQENSTLPWIDCSQIDAMNRSQTFKPSLNRIVSVDLYLAARVDNASITLTITKDSDGSTVGETTQQLSGGINETWETFAFTDPFVTVVPEETYSLNLLASEDQTRICYTNDRYSRGYYRTVPDTDWLFKIYGKSVANSSTPASASSSTNNTTTSIKTGTIQAPSNLEATYNDPLKVQLIWTKSTSTNISGYNIYRSLNKTSDLSKLSSVDKNIAEFKDEVGLEFGKTYYYYVRSYNSSIESTNSNEAFVNIPTTTINDTKVIQPWYKKYLIFLIIGGIIIIAGLITLFFLLKKRSKYSSGFKSHNNVKN